MKKQKIYKNLYIRFLGFLTKKGNKRLAKKILNKALIKTAIRLNVSVFYVLLKLFLKLNSFIEIKKLKFRKKIHYFPVPVPLQRRAYLVVKSILEVVKKNKQKISFDEKLSLEFINILMYDSSEVLRLKKENESNAVLYKSKTHYRWK